MLEFDDARKMMANALLEGALDIAILCEEDTGKVPALVDEITRAALEMMPEDAEPLGYFWYFADGVTDGFSWEFVVEDDADKTLAEELVEGGELDVIPEDRRFKGACYILSMEELNEFPNSYTMQDKVEAARAYADGHILGRERYSYRANGFEDAAIYTRQMPTKKVLAGIAGK